MKRPPLAVFLAWSCCGLATEPRPDANALTLPTFLFERRHAITAGVAFLAEENGQRFLVTAYHVLGPAGGLKVRIAPREVPREVKAIAGLCLGESEKVVVVGAPVLLVEDARPIDDQGGEHDVTLALVKDSNGPTPLKLSVKASAVGDRVWLFGRMMDRDRPMTYAGKITQVSATTLQYELEDSSLNLRALSGAPILAEDGSVVGMHLGFGKMDDKLVAAAAPAVAIRERIAAATRKEE